MAYWTSTTALSQSADLSFNNGRFGVGTSTAGSLISFAGDGTASTSLLLSGINTIYASSSTSTIASALNAFSIATSTSAIPMLTFDTTNSRVGFGSTSPATAFSVAGASYFNGNVGVGTSSPYALLSVEANTTATDLFVVGDYGTTSPLFVVKGSGNVGIGTTSTAGARLHVVLPSAAPDTDNAFEVWDNSADVSPFVIKGDGNVGIDDTSPAVKLEVGDDLDSQIFINGVTDPGWTVPAVQLGGRASVFATSGTSGGHFAENQYFDGSNFRYIATAQASRIQLGGDIIIKMGASGTAGNAFTATDHTVFTNGGGIQVGAPTGGDKGAGTLNATAVF
ncbi:MAG: hypothetical protein AAB834_01790, partial [Patescibacteria group bacterium]